MKVHPAMLMKTKEVKKWYLVPGVRRQGGSILAGGAPFLAVRRDYSG